MSYKLSRHDSSKKLASFFTVTLLFPLVISTLRLSGETNGFIANSFEGFGAGTGVGVNSAETVSLPTIVKLSKNVCVGDSITITGTNLNTAISVTIGGTAVSITSNTSKEIIAVAGTACSGTVSVTTNGGTVTSEAIFTAYSYPAAPTVTTPINYCLDAPALPLTATGSNLSWGSTISATAGGTNTLSTQTYIDGTSSNKKTIFATTAPNVKFTNIDYYIPSWQAVNGLVLAIYNSSGTAIATSSTSTTLTAGNSTVKVSNEFNYTIAAPGDYSIGVYSGSGNIGYDSPSSFPITESTGTINIKGVSVSGVRCFNNIQFTVNKSSTTAPTPITSVAGTTNYLLSQTVNGCVSPQATIGVVVNKPAVALISYGGSPFCQSIGTAQVVTQSGTSGGTYSATPSGLNIDFSTGAITPSSSTAGDYTVTYSVAAPGGCSAQTATTSVTINATPAAPIVTTPIYYCLNDKASPLTAIGSNLTWSPNGGSSGSVVDNILSEDGQTNIWVNNAGNNYMTNFTTRLPNVTIASIDYYIPINQAVNGLQLAIFNNSGKVIAISNTITTQPQRSSTLTVSNSFNYTIAAAGDYSIGVYSGSGNIGYDRPQFPITEPTGTVIVTGFSPAWGAHCFNNFRFTESNASIAPTPNTSVPGSTDYKVTQTVNGCVSPQATIKVIVSVPSSATITYSGSPFCQSIATAQNVTIKGTGGGSYSASPSGLSIDFLTGAITPSTSIPGNYTVTYTIAASGCGAYSTTANVSIAALGGWIGATSTNWNDSRNWSCGQIPNSSIDAIIGKDANFYPALTPGIVNASAKNIIIQRGGTITVSGGTLQIFGTISNEGAFDVSNGTIEMHGASPQTIPAGAFANNNVKNLIISNTSTAGVTLAGNVNIYRSLTFGTNGTQLNTGGYLSLKSTATETAWIGNMTGHTINGDVTVERYSAAINNWQFLSVPTNTIQTIHQAWQENQEPGSFGTIGYGTNITGPTGGIGFDFISPNASMKYWDNSAGAYKTIMNTGIQFPNKTNGFFVYIRGDRRATASSTTPHGATVLRTKGPLYTGSKDFTIPAKSYYSIGNPYASQINFGDVAGMSAVGSIFYVWDPLIYGSRGVGGYETLSEVTGYKPLVPTNYYNLSTAYPYLESGQAAFVYNSSNSPVALTFNESDKTSGSHLAFRERDISSGQIFRTYLSTSSGKIADGNAVGFGKGYSNGIDVNDAIKISNTGENFSLKRNGIILSIEARSPVQPGDTLYYDMKNVAQANYQLSFNPENMQGDAVAPFLVDNYLKSKTEISLVENTAVNFTVNPDLASYAADRFMIVFEKAAVLPVTFVAVKATEKNKNVLVAWQVESENNIQQYEVEKSTDGNYFEKVATTAAKNDGSENYQWTDENATSGYNYYRVRSVGKDNNSQYSTIAKVLVGNLKSAINIYPNPISGEIVHLLFTNQLPGKYHIRLLNSQGAVVLTKEIEFSGGNGSQDIKWDSKIARGIYQVEIAKPGGSIVIIKIMY